MGFVPYRSFSGGGRENKHHLIYLHWPANKAWERRFSWGVWTHENDGIRFWQKLHFSVHVLHILEDISLNISGTKLTHALKKQLVYGFESICWGFFFLCWRALTEVVAPCISQGFVSSVFSKWGLSNPVLQTEWKHELYVSICSSILNSGGREQARKWYIKWYILMIYKMIWPG